jgi:hypothetical protein
MRHGISFAIDDTFDGCAAARHDHLLGGSFSASIQTLITGP